MGIFDNVSSIVINNKEVQSIVMTSNNAVLYEKEIVGGYHMTFSSIYYPTVDEHTYTGVDCTLTYDGSPVSDATISLTGDDGSSYTFTTDANGVAQFLLYCKSISITYTATYGEYTATFTKPTGTDTRLQPQKPTCAKTTSGSGSSKKQVLTYTVKDERGAVVPNINLTVIYSYKTSSSSSGAYEKASGTTNNSGKYTLSFKTGTASYPKYSCAVDGTTNKRPSVSPNWKYRGYTYVTVSS